MAKKLTNEDIEQKMYELVKDEYIKLDDVYLNSQTRFPIKHNLCGHEYEVTWGNFRNGNRCPKCNRNSRKLRGKSPLLFTNDDIIKKMYDLVKDEYTIISEYKNQRSLLKIKHNICDNICEISWNSFNAGQRCKKCNSKKRREKILNDLRKSSPDYTFLKLEDNNSKRNLNLIVRHNICGYEYKTSIGNFRRGIGCRRCYSSNCYYSDSEMEKMISDITNGEYVKLSTYVNTRTKFLIRHNICGHEYKIGWNSFRNGRRCPKCNQSKGEKLISDYLTNRNISFTTEVKFDNCIYNGLLRFDFGIVGSDKKVIALIEFDGVQHFKPSRFKTNITQEQAEEALKQTQLRDQIKNQYCKDNNIPLLRIRYDEDIEEKLTEFLKEQNIIEGE